MEDETMDNKPLSERLQRHAKDFECTEAEPDEPGYLVHDLRMAADAIVNLGAELVLVKHGHNDFQAEIARLRAENEDLRRWKALDKPVTAAMAVVKTDMARLRAKVERLRAYLQNIENHELRDWEDYEAIKEIARAARSPDGEA